MKDFKVLIARIGEKKLREILNDFYDEMSRDILIGFFFAGKDLNQIADRQADFILKASGIKKEYAGKAPQLAHLELAPILGGHFDRRLVILKSVLKAQGFSDEDMRIWIRFEKSFRNAVVN